MAAGSWNVSQSSVARNAFGSWLYKLTVSGGFCTNGSSVYSKWFNGSWGETYWIGGRDGGQTYSNAVIASGSARIVGQRAFYYDVGGWDVQSPKPCIRLFGYLATWLLERRNRSGHVIQPLVTPKAGRVPVSAYFLIAAAALMLIPVFPVTGVSAALSTVGLVLAIREAPGRNRAIVIVLASVLLVAAVGITLLSLQTSLIEPGRPTVEPR